MNLKIISAGAGSGKTYRLMSEMVQLLESQKVKPTGIIATTFTNKAAAELEERVRVKLLEQGMNEAANELSNALIGTVHGLGVKLLKRFAFEAGVSPQVDIMPDENSLTFFNQALAMVLEDSTVQRIETLANSLDLNSKDSKKDWRSWVLTITDLARNNDFDDADLEKSKQQSIASYFAFLPKVSTKAPEVLEAQFHQAIMETIELLKNGADKTKKTKTYITRLQTALLEYQNFNHFKWVTYASVAKGDVGAKSRENIEALQLLANDHLKNPRFREEIKEYISLVFDIALEAQAEYEKFKRKRGLIDYTDMESLINKLLDNPTIQEVLSEELDLLMVDEFQDTSPLQLAIFYKLSKFAKYSVWVGDPKQSIYGFRGAEPELMQAIIQAAGGVKAEDIQAFSWRSREDIVYATNAIFTKAFPTLAKQKFELPDQNKKLEIDQVALIPKRTINDNPLDASFKAEPLEMQNALVHWHFKLDPNEKTSRTNVSWFMSCIAETLRDTLEKGLPIFDKKSQKTKMALPSDVAILCRSNKECEDFSAILHQAGLQSAIARTGLLETSEVKLVLACLKLMLNSHDALSIAEIRYLAHNESLSEIVEDRLDFIQSQNTDAQPNPWSSSDALISTIAQLKKDSIELSSSEILNLLLEELSLRRIISTWGRKEQRLDNIDQLRAYALQYEEHCNSLHAAASLGGFLLWLSELASRKNDQQAAGAGVEAINLMTYHKSKGLEFPVLICFSLEKGMRDNTFGISIQAESDTVDLDDILGNRWIRFWVNPYGANKKGLELIEKIQASPNWLAAQRRTREEEARLLYVGVTRARDYLILPTREKNPPLWLRRTYNEDGNEQIPVLDADSPETPWIWNDRILLKDTEIAYFARAFQQTEIKSKRYDFIEKPSGRKSHLPYYIDTNSYKIPKLKINILKSSPYAPEWLFEDFENPTENAKAFNAFLLGYDPNLPLDVKEEQAHTLVENYEMEVDADFLIDMAERFYAHLRSRFEYDSLHRYYPVEGNYQGQHFSTYIDILLENEKEYYLVQLSSFRGDTKHFKSKIKDLAAWYALTSTSLERATQKSVKTYCFVPTLKSAFVELTLQNLSI